MKHIALVQYCLAVVLAVILTVHASAQSAPVAREHITLHVEGLTSATRDDLSRELKHSGEMEIAFACIPAGIIVFEARKGQSKTQLEAGSRLLLSRRSSGSNARNLNRSLAQAEAACEQARNR